MPETDTSVKELMDIVHSKEFQQVSNIDFTKAYTGEEIVEQIQNEIVDLYNKYIKDNTEKPDLRSVISEDLANMFHHKYPPTGDVNIDKDLLFDYIKETYDAMELDKEKDKIKDSMQELNNMLIDTVDASEDSRRDIMENRLIKKAEELEDGEEKQTLLAISKSYTNSYTLDPLKEFIHTDGFANKYRKAMIRKNRLFTNIDYKIDAVTHGRVTINDIYKNINRSVNSTDSRVISFEDNDADKFCITLAMYANNLTTSKEDVWYIYCSYINILSVMIEAVTPTKTDFYKEKLNHLNEFLEDPVWKEIYSEINSHKDR